MKTDSIGIGVITCDRPDFFEKLITSLKNVKYDKLVVINDGSKQVKIKEAEIVKNRPSRQGVGKSKNKALKLLKNYDYIFILEDDIFIKDQNVFQKYINASKLSGIQHFNFAFHGIMNYQPNTVPLNSVPAVALKIDYSPTVSVSLYPHIYGAFSMYTKRCIEKVGYMDEFYYNAMEHVDHTVKTIEAGMHPPFRWFADIAESYNYIQEQDSDHSSSEIRKDQKWLDNFHKSATYFAQKYGFDVRNNYAPVASKEETIKIIKEIKKLYGEK
jgi:glycosyltransferase involved in cell wall biosynthesis